MTCTCSPDLLLPENESKRYAQKVLLELPAGSERTRRIAAGLSSQVAIDPCIADQIKALWILGIETLGCCCGHNKLPAFVDVQKEDFELMHSMGFEKIPVNEHGHGNNSFLLT